MAKTTETLISTILAEVAQIGPAGAVWGEADGDAGYLVRGDGAVLGIGDYQAVWLQGGSYQEGPTLGFAGAYDSASFNTPMQLAQDVEWRGEDRALHQLPAGTPVMVEIIQSGMGPIYSIMDPSGGAGMTLDLDASLLQKRPAARPAGP